MSYIDIESQSRRKNWDVFGVLLMMIHSDCGPHGEVHLPDCHLLQTCRAGTSGDCVKLCEKASDPRKSKYSKFCDNYDSDGSTSSSSSANSASGADAYSENSSPDAVAGSGSYSVEFRFWMAAVALSVGMALVAIHMGQKREIRLAGDDENETAPGEIRGSIRHRVGVVSDIMDSVLSDRVGTRVEMSGYKLDTGADSAIV